MNGDWEAMMDVMKIATTAQIRDLDRRAIEEYGIPGVILMENAGRGAADVAAEMLGDARGKRVLILCGKGNNGGDGFVVGRHLHNRRAIVEFWLAADPESIDPKSDAGINFNIARRMNLPIKPIADAAAVPPRIEGDHDLLIDALLGTGLTGEVREPYRSLINLINASGKPVLAIDTPSGLNTDTGEILGFAVHATRTVTFAAAKPGFFIGDGPQCTGKINCADIGVPAELIDALT
jgi:NAD(P)H-hydrate epimerase